MSRRRPSSAAALAILTAAHARIRPRRRAGSFLMFVAVGDREDKRDKIDSYRFGGGGTWRWHFFVI
jgi:hypothetical protein